MLIWQLAPLERNLSPSSALAVRADDDDDDDCDHDDNNEQQQQQQVFSRSEREKVT